MKKGKYFGPGGRNPGHPVGGPQPLSVKIVYAPDVIEGVMQMAGRLNVDPSEVINQGLRYFFFGVGHRQIEAFATHVQAATDDPPSEKPPVEDSGQTAEERLAEAKRIAGLV